MRRRLVSLLSLILVLAACSSAKVKKQQEEIDRFKAAAGRLEGEVKDREGRIETLKSEKAELEGKADDLAEKLKAAQARIDSLAQSNEELSKSMEADKGGAGAQVKQLVKEKDELSRRLNETRKEKIAAERDRSSLLARREKTLAELASLKQQLADLSDKKEKEAEERTRRLAKAHEEMGALADAMLKELQSEQARIAQSGENIEIALSETLLFEPNQAKLTQAGASLLDRLGSALRSLPPHNLRIEGHSDNSPIKWELFGRFTSHWDLSSARATAVARYLHEHAGLDPRRMAATGFGEFKPVKANDTPEGRAANRRVVLIVEPPSS